MPLTVGGATVNSTQAADIRAALGITDAAPITARLTSMVGTDDLLAFRDVSGTPTAHLVAASVVDAYVDGGAGPTVPSAFVVGNWTATAGDGQATLGINTLPSDGGSAITALQYRIDAGTAVTMSGTGTGDRIVTGLTNGTEVDFEVRAVNAVGNGPWSDVKPVTPAAAGVTYIEFATLSSMTAGGAAGATRTYTGTAAEGTAGGPSVTLPMGSAGGLQVQIANGGTDPMIGLYTSASGAWNAGIQIIMYKSSADWVVNDAAFNTLQTATTYTAGDNARLRYDTGNTYFAEIERAAAPGVWVTIATGTLARTVTLYGRLCSFGGSGVVFTAPRVP